jgi:hypothetical protein
MNYQIKTIWENNRRLGFIARRSVIYGCAQEVSDGWMYSRHIIAPLWVGNYSTRKLATEALKNDQRS